MNEMKSAPESAKQEPKYPVGEVIKEARKAKKLTQKDLGKLAGVNPVSLSRIETGLVYPVKSTLQKISPHIGVPYPELLIKAGYSNARGEGALYGKDGAMLDLLGIVTSIYRADSDLLGCFRDFEKYATEENVEVIKILLMAMRKEVDATESNNVGESSFNLFFTNTLGAVRRFLLEMLTPVVS